MKAKQNRVFKYTCGETVERGDSISLIEVGGVVVAIMQPNSNEAIDHDCSNTGGILISFENGDLQLWVDTDEDLVFVGRKKS